MRVLILDQWCHHKNRQGLQLILVNLNWFYKFGSEQDINDFDIIYSPSNPINTDKYKNKKFIFGPHMSVFPNNKLYQINNINNNSIYIQPSLWPITSWEYYSFYNEFQKSNLNMEFKVFSFPVDTVRFCPNNNQKCKVFIYFKHRAPTELSYIKNFLTNKKIDYSIFDYDKKYNENEYLLYLQQSLYGIILDAHESQGFAIEEALSCNVPLLVWNTRYMSQEYSSKYENIHFTTIPYLNDKCGEYFYEQN